MSPTFPPSAVALGEAMGVQAGEAGALAAQVGEGGGGLVVNLAVHSQQGS